MVLTGNPRKPDAPGVDNIFVDRWSPRAFSPEPLTQEEIDTLFEAARWAPSSTNSQPWLFLYATDGPEREVFDSLLREGNRRWAPNAPLLAFVLARKTNPDGRVLRTAQFDTGAAWMSLALQAHLMGLHTHAMGGVLLDDVYDRLGISRDEYEVIAAIAIGRYGDPSELVDDLPDREKPSQRKPLAEVARPWKTN